MIIKIIDNTFSKNSGTSCLHQVYINFISIMLLIIVDFHYNSFSSSSIPNYEKNTDSQDLNINYPLSIQ